MSDLITRLVEQFRSKTQYQHFVRENQQKFDINTYRFQRMTVASARKAFNELRQKYDQHLLEQTPRSWHQNERKEFVWFLLALLKYLKDNHQKMDEQHWEQLSETFFNKDILFLKYQFNAIQKNRKRNDWTQQQDQILRSCQQHIQNTNWNQIAKQIFFQTNGKHFKSSKQCRQRWQNHLDNRIKKQQWDPQQDLVILNFVLQNGKKWSKIVEELNNTRTQHMVKNRFKSLIAKAETDAKIEKIKLESQKSLIHHIINQITTKSEFVDKKSSLENGSQAKDIVEQDIPHIKLNGPKKSHIFHGCLERGQNGQFPQSYSTKSSPAPNIFQQRSPAPVSLTSSGFVYTHSIFTPQSGTPNGQNYSFLNCQQRWNKVLKKTSNTSQKSTLTSKLIGCSRKQDNLKFSFELDSLEGGDRFLPQVNTPIIQSVENFVFNGNDNSFLNPHSAGSLDNSQKFTRTLQSNFPIEKTKDLSQSQFLERVQRKFNKHTQTP